jgi:spore germination cell wall hydrolase CwlJ-like protein
LGRASAADALAETCLTTAVYYESAKEPRAGKEGVAQVVLNRLADVRFPKSVCDVVYQGATRRTGCQFSFTCDGSLRRRPEAGAWTEARDVARSALGGYRVKELAQALNFHADYVTPYWKSSVQRVTQIGRHIFYAPKGLGPVPGAASTSPDAPAAPPPAGIWGLDLRRISSAQQRVEQHRAE